MVIDLNAYRHTTKPLVQIWCEVKGGPPHTHISDLALVTSCHIVAVSYYVGELYGFTPELKDSINKLVDFYKITAILNKEERKSNETH